MKQFQISNAKCTLWFVLLIMFSISLNAQENDIVDAEKPLELETIMITAEKRKQKAQEVPAAISVFSETALEDADVDEIRDLTVLVPNLELGDFGDWKYRVNFRGMNASMLTQKLPVVMYVDNVPYDDGYTFDGDFDNIERIEVLRGAQGTLYGRNALAGVINIISKTPDNEPEGRASVEGGQYNTYGAQASYNGPLQEDKLFFGFSGSYKQTDGFLKNDHPDEDTFGGGKTTRAKGRLRWLATDNLEANIGLLLYQYRNIGAVGNTITGLEYVDHAYRNPDDIGETDTSQLSLDLDYQTAGLRFKSITTSRTTDKKWVLDYSNFLPTMGRADDSYKMTVLTQEFRLLPRDEDKTVKWMVGLFLAEERKDWQNSGMEMYGTYYNYPCDVKSSTHSVFGQATAPLGERMSATVGLRYETIKKEGDLATTMTPTGGPTTTLSSYSISKDWSATLPRFVFSYQLNPDNLAYFSAAQGYLPGGFNSSEMDKTKADFDAQYSTTYEIGAKTAWLQNRLTFNATVFQTDITDMQVYQIPTPGVRLASNAGKAQTRGVELELAVRPLAGLDLSANIGQLDTEYIDYEGYDGNEIAHSPEYSAALSVTYRHESGVYAGTVFQGKGDAWADDDNTTKNEGYWLANAKVGYEKSNWDVYLQVENLNNVEYFEFIEVYGGTYLGNLGKPRTINITASTRF